MENPVIRRTRVGRLATLAVGLAVVLLTVGAIYKWTDKEGKVHYSDTPPPGEHHVVTVQPGPTAEQQAQARQRAQAIAETVQRNEAGKSTEAAGSKPQEAIVDPDRAARSCADAMVQRQTLDLQTPVYRRSGPGDFQYLADADRPAEKARLDAAIRSWCSDDPAQASAVRQRFVELSLGRRPRCIELRDELQDRVLRGETLASEGVQLAAARLRQFGCLEVPIDGVWLAKQDYQLQAPR